MATIDKINKSKLDGKALAFYEKLEKQYKVDKDLGEKIAKQFYDRLESKNHPAVAKKKAPIKKKAPAKKVTTAKAPVKKAPAKKVAPKKATTKTTAKRGKSGWQKEVKKIQADLGITYKEATRVYKARRKDTKGKSESISALISRFKKDFGAVKPNKTRNLDQDGKIPAKTAVKRKSPTYGKKGGAKQEYYYEYRMNRRDNSKVPAYLEEGGRLTARTRFTDYDLDRLSYDFVVFDDRVETEDGKVVGTINSKGHLVPKGDKTLKNPLVKWLQQNSYVSNEEYQKLAKGGTLYGDGKMYKYSSDGYVKEVRDVNGKLLKEITNKGKKYRRNSTYKTYNSVDGNELLHQSQIGNKMAKGGEVQDVSEEIYADTKWVKQPNTNIKKLVFPFKNDTEHHYVPNLPYFYSYFEKYVKDKYNLTDKAVKHSWDMYKRKLMNEFHEIHNYGKEFRVKEEDLKIGQYAKGGRVFTEKEMQDIMALGTISNYNKKEQRQIFEYAFGKDFMDEDDELKGRRRKYDKAGNRVTDPDRDFLAKGGKVDNKAYITETYNDGFALLDSKERLIENGFNSISEAYEYGISNGFDPQTIAGLKMAKGGKIKDYNTALGIIVMQVGKNPKLDKYKTKSGIKIGEIKDLGETEVIKLANSLNSSMAKGGELAKSSGDYLFFKEKGGPLKDKNYRYIPKEEVIKIVKKNGKELENDYGKLEFLSGAYISEKAVNEQVDKNQLKMFKEGGKMPKDSVYIKRNEIDYITIGEDIDEPEKIEGKYLINGFWLDPKQQKEFLASQKPKMAKGGELRSKESDLKEYVKEIEKKHNIDIEYGGYEEFDGENLFFVHYEIPEEKLVKNKLEEWVKKSKLKDIEVYEATDNFSDYDGGFWTMVVSQFDDDKMAKGGKIPKVDTILIVSEPFEAEMIEEDGEIEMMTLAPGDKVKVTDVNSSFWVVYWNGNDYRLEHSDIQYFENPILMAKGGKIDFFDKEHEKKWNNSSIEEREKILSKTSFSDKYKYFDYKDLTTSIKEKLKFAKGGELEEISLEHKAKIYYMDLFYKGKIDTLPNNPKEAYIREMMKNNYAKGGKIGYRE